MNQSINTDSKNSKEPQQKYRLGTVSIKILGGLNRFYGRPTSPSASIMAQNIQLFGPRGGSHETKSPRKNVPDVGIELGAACMPSEHASDRATTPGGMR